MTIRKPKWHFNYYKSKYWSWKLGILYQKKLLWKDKYNTPRTEREPHISLWFGFWTIELRQGSDEEWEQYLWITKYCDNNLQKAKETWGWTNQQGISTWEDKYYI